MKLLITDMDNTLYDWVTFYSQSFEAMATALSRKIDIPLDNILKEYKEVHQRYGNSEKPFATLELPSVIKHFNTDKKSVLKEELSDVFKAFSDKRKETLKLYDGVQETLEFLSNHGVKIVAHTEALEFNSIYRVDKLNLHKYLTHLYTLEDNNSLHPSPEKAKAVSFNNDFIVRLPKEDAKPNPSLLKAICSREGVDIKDAMYVGDSLVKDISMAKEIGMPAAWATYGRDFSPSCWNILVKVTHWTEADVKREEALKLAYSNVKPDLELSSFTELKNIYIANLSRSN